MYFSLLSLCALCLPLINGMVVNLCQDSEMKRCLGMAEELLSKENAGFVADTEETLTVSCKHGNETLSCIDDYVNRCFDSIMRETYKIITSGAHSLLTDVCTEGSEFRKEYLKHAPCFGSVNSEYRQCAAYFVMENKFITSVTLNMFERLKRQCCLFDRYVQCTREAVLSKCSEDAADMGEKILRKIAGPAVESYCSSYKFRSPKCLAASSTMTSSFLTSNSYQDFNNRISGTLRI